MKYKEKKKAFTFEIQSKYFLRLIFSLGIQTIKKKKKSEKQI